MKLKNIVPIAVVAAVLTLTACGQQSIHDTNKKQNTHQADLTEAQSAKIGSTETLSGKYIIEGTKNTFYVIEKDNLSIVESGEYSFSSDGSISIQYGNNSPVTYKVEENEAGFNLTVKEQSILLPLEYMEGTDGLMDKVLFDGVYGVINGGPGYVFHSDGSINVVTTHDAEVTEDSISFEGLSYKWRMRDGKVEFLDASAVDSSSDENSEPKVVITMVPTDGND